MANYTHLTPPTEGSAITVKNGQLVVPDNPIIPFIEGDGTGPDIWRASVRVFDAAVEKAFGGDRARSSGSRCSPARRRSNLTNEWLPNDTLEAAKAYKVAIKGPLTTPVGGGIRSLNVTLRQVLDLYACVRPVRYFAGTPAPVTHPERMNVVIFRENTEDVYAGIEFAQGHDAGREADRVPVARAGEDDRAGLGHRHQADLGDRHQAPRAHGDPATRSRTTARRVTLVHKGNIMKFTEGAFRDWGYEVAKAEFRDKIVTEEETWAGASKEGKLLINDRIADSVFQQILTRTAEYDVFATPNLNGDYLSDACAAQVGGLGMAPGANIGDEIAFFEATHGTAPKYAGKDVINPGSVILSGVMMFRHLGWDEAARPHRAGARRHHRAEEGHLRPRAADGRRHRAQDVAVRRRHHREHEELARGSHMNRKVTVVGGAGNVGATVARAIANKELADVVLIDIADSKAKGVALDIYQACPIEGSDARLIGSGDYADSANSDVVVITSGVPRKPGHEPRRPAAHQLQDHLVGGRAGGEALAELHHRAGGQPARRDVLGGATS